MHISQSASCPAIGSTVRLTAEGTNRWNHNAIYSVTGHVSTVGCNATFVVVELSTHRTYGFDECVLRHGCDEVKMPLYMVDQS